MAKGSCCPKFREDAKLGCSEKKTHLAVRDPSQASLINKNAPGPSLVPSAVQGAAGTARKEKHETPPSSMRGVKESNQKTGPGHETIC